MKVGAAALMIALMSCSVAMTTTVDEASEGPTPAPAEYAAQICTFSAAAVAEAAQQVCGGAPIEEALRSVHLQQAAEDVGRMLAELGFQTALDLQLLTGGPEVAELLGELKAGGLPIGDRAKFRLLVGGKVQFDRGLVSGAATPEPNPTKQPASATARDDDDHHHQDDELSPRRQLRKQDDGSATSRRRLQDEAGMSMDTIAIVLTVLVGSAGYLVQALTTRRAERAAVDQARTHS